MNFNFENINLWNSEHIVSDKEIQWNAHDKGGKVFVNNKYAEFTSGKYIVALLYYLISRCAYDQITIRSIDYKGESTKIWPVSELDEFVMVFESYAHRGEWFFVSGAMKEVSRDLLNLLNDIPENGFMVYINLDSGLIAVMGQTQC